MLDNYKTLFLRNLKGYQKALTTNTLDQQFVILHLKCNHVKVDTIVEVSIIQLLCQSLYDFCLKSMFLEKNKYFQKLFCNIFF